MGENGPLFQKTISISDLERIVASSPLSTQADTVVGWTLFNIVRLTPLILIYTFSGYHTVKRPDNNDIIS